MQAGKDFQQGGLAATGWADQRYQLAVLDIEACLRHRQKLGTACAIDLADAGQVDERLGHDRHCRRASRPTSRRSSPSTRAYSTLPMIVIKITAMNIAAVSSVTCTCSIR